MIDPVQSLAFSIQANRGVYAVLLGSGVSRDAKIPTGWEVTLDFIRKLAKLCDETCDTDPELWHRQKFDRDADYSDLLNELAKTQAEKKDAYRTTSPRPWARRGRPRPARHTSRRLRGSLR